MAKQQDNPNRPVWRAVLLVVFASAVFAAAIYYSDGLSVVDEYFGTTFASAPPVIPEAVDTAEGINLPGTMSEAFALRMWQEQIDSQENINRLVNGEISAIVFKGVRESASNDEDSVVYDINAEYADGTSAPGVLAMRRFDEYWYFAYVEGVRNVETQGFADSTSTGDDAPPDSPLPGAEDVDIPLLNTILKQQRESSQVLDEYAEGAVRVVRITNVIESLGTATLSIEMEENHETTQGEIVAVSKEIDGTKLWFVARFTKIATD